MLKKDQGDFGKYKVKGLAKETIEAEEIFLDSEKIKKSPESEKEKIEFPIKKGRVYFIYFSVLVLFLALFIRTTDLQVIKGKYWRDLAEENRIRSYPIESLRGMIMDRNNKPLVANEPGFNLVAIPTDLLKQKDKLSETLSSLAEILKEPKEEIENALQDNAGLSVPIVIKENIPRETALVLESKFAENPAIFVEITSQRNYIDGVYFSYILGYVGKISQEEREKHPDYPIDDYIGKTGLEFYYENILRGSYGEKLVEVDSQGKIQNIFAQKDPSVGKNITLSIDGDLQKKLYYEINQMLRALGLDRAAGVALDPTNGQILALVSFPGFDNNKFVQGLSKKDFEKFIQNPSKPLFNRAISGTYPLGSTIKPLIAAAALNERIVTPNQIINCSGSITIYHPYYPNIFYTFHDWKAHGSTNITKAIAESCDVYFYTIGGGYGSIEGLGVEKIKQYLTQFGLGEVLGIDLPNEAKGLVPDEDWKHKNKNEDWYIGDTYNISIGQGDLLATPLQIALATAAIANNGTLFRPQIVNKIDDDPVSSQIIRNNIIDKEMLDVIKKGMRETIISGTAKPLYDLPIKVAGKTGTAQAPGGKTHGWFIAFAPYDNPEIVLVILIENGGEGSAVAVPIAKEVLRWYFSR